jgi:hypothetical protein
MSILKAIFRKGQTLLDQTVTHAEATFYNQFDYLQEVPFHRWWVYTHFDARIDTTCDRWKARGWALLALVEGSLRALISAIAMVYNRCYGDAGVAAKKHEYMMRLQGTGLKYTLWAIWSPNGPKDDIRAERAKYAENPSFGFKKGKAPCGTPYNGTLTIDFCTVDHPWHIKSGDRYPWEQ